MKRKLFPQKVSESIAASRAYDWIGSSHWMTARSPFIQKCRETPGGFQPLEMIYDNGPVGDSFVQRLADRYYLNAILPRAARERLQQATDWLARQIEARAAVGARVAVLSLACGGARDAIDVIAHSPFESRVTYLGVDIDPAAVGYARERALAVGLNGNFRVEPGNALRPPRSWQASFDIVTSLGLFDYLKDATVILLLNRIHRLLRPNGALLFGMVTRNPNQRFFEDYLNWKMVYRPPEQILELARASKFEAIHPVSGHDDYFFLVECKKT